MAADTPADVEIFSRQASDVDHVDQSLVSGSSNLTASCVPLSHGKRYHVFFSHDNRDLEWVRQTVEKLESPDYGFKCCYADRDFTPGETIFNNIVKCIQASRRTVIVLSPDFLRSQWCSYETRVTLEMDLDAKQRLLVPVMLRHCKVPEFIGRLTYLDVNNQHFWDRFTDTIRVIDVTAAADTESDSFIAPPFNFNPNYYNGDLVEELVVYPGVCRCAELETVVSEHGIPTKLKSDGIQVRKRDYQFICREVVQSFFVRFHCCFTGACALVPTILFGQAVIWWLIRGAIEIANESREKADVTEIINYILLDAVLLVLAVVLIVAAKVYSNYFRKAMLAAIRLMSKYNLLVCLKDVGCCGCRGNKLSIVFYYYEWQPCRMWLEQLLRSQQLPTETLGVQTIDNTEQSDDVQLLIPTDLVITSSPAQTPATRDTRTGDSVNVNMAATEDDAQMLLVENSDSSDEEAVLVNSVESSSLAADAALTRRIQKEAMELMVKYSVEYGKLLVEERLLTPVEQRHTRHLECLCQYIEALMVDCSSNNSLTRRLCPFVATGAVRSRRPWRNCCSYY